jgi:hypothetical protein
MVLYHSIQPSYTTYQTFNLSHSIQDHPMQVNHSIQHRFDTMNQTLPNPSAQNKVVHMELRLHLSFHLRRSLGCYTVGTTARFQVKTVEALAPWTHHRIPQQHPQ